MKKRIPKGLTLTQLAKIMLRELKRMSPAEKAEWRKAFEKSMGQPRHQEWIN